MATWRLAAETLLVQELLKQWNRLMEEMLHLLIVVIGKFPTQPVLLGAFCVTVSVLTD